MTVNSTSNEHEEQHLCSVNRPCPTGNPNHYLTGDPDIVNGDPKVFIGDPKEIVKIFEIVNCFL